jgi:tetrahydromethanopterin S-methyltransferase subunit G
MFELLLRFETLFSTLSMPVLLGTGSGMLVVGVILWLFGQRYGAVIIGLIGAAWGTVCGRLVGQRLGFHQYWSMGIGALILTIVTILLRNAIILMLAVSIFAMISGAGYVSMQLDTMIQASGADPNTPSVHGSELSSQSPAKSFTNMLSPEQRLAYFEKLSPSDQTFSEKMQAMLTDTWQVISPNVWKVIGICLGGAAVGILLIWIVKKLVVALAYSVVGSTSLLFGLQILLLGTGIKIVSRLPQNPWLLPSVFGGLVLFGWIGQAVFAKPAKGKAKASVDEGEDGDDEGEDALGSA